MNEIEPARTADFHAALDAAIADGERVSLALIDVDGFGLINCENGRHVADSVLQTVAEKLRESGQSYRIAGDEFAVIKPDLGLEQTFLWAEAVRARLAQAEISTGSSTTRFTVTIGVANYPRDARTAHDLLNSASAALDSAKENGRDQVGLPPNDEMVLKSCYYTASSVRKLKAVAGRLNRKESAILREALDTYLRNVESASGANGVVLPKQHRAAPPTKRRSEKALYMVSMADGSTRTMRCAGADQAKYRAYRIARDTGVDVLSYEKLLGD